MSKTSEIELTYRFNFPDGIEKVFVVRLDRKSGALDYERPENPPEWAELGFRQCGNCPLSTDTHKHCPVALSIVDIVEFFQNSVSVEEAEVVVDTRQRVTRRGKGALFPAISSLIGIHMVGSGCPVFHKLRPMVRYHLPFADTEETMYRALSMYALGQYFREKAGLEPDLDFEGLKELYRQVNKVNRDFVRRLHNESISEATENAITSLDCFAQMIDFSVSEEMLDEVESLFEAYMKD